MFIWKQCFIVKSLPVMVGVRLIPKLSQILGYLLLDLSFEWALTYSVTVSKYDPESTFVICPLDTENPPLLIVGVIIRKIKYSLHLRRSLNKHAQKYLQTMNLDKLFCYFFRLYIKLYNPIVHLRPNLHQLLMLQVIY